MIIRRDMQSQRSNPTNVENISSASKKKPPTVFAQPKPSSTTSNQGMNMMQMMGLAMQNPQMVQVIQAMVENKQMMELFCTVMNNPETAQMLLKMQNTFVPQVISPTQKPVYTQQQEVQQPKPKVQPTKLRELTYQEKKLCAYYKIAAKEFLELPSDGHDTLWEDYEMDLKVERDKKIRDELGLAEARAMHTRIRLAKAQRQLELTQYDLHVVNSNSNSNTDKIAANTAELKRVKDVVKQNYELLSIPRAVEQYTNYISQHGGDNALSLYNSISGDISGLFTLGEIRKSVQMTDPRNSVLKAVGSVASIFPFGGVIKAVCSVAGAGVIRLLKADYKKIKKYAPAAIKRPGIASIIAANLVLDFIAQKGSKAHTFKAGEIDKISSCVRVMLFKIMTAKTFKKVLKANGRDYAKAVLSEFAKLKQPNIVKKATIVS